MDLFSLENLVRQYRACRRNKRNTANALRFEARQELNLLELRDELVSRSYEPARSVCFFVRRPKLREVFAAEFRDRVVHHVLVSHLEQTWEPIFIHDSYACRRGKGVHKAVSRLQRFMRQATANGTRQAFALHLDVRNYFMSIDKARLFDMLDARLKDENARWLTRTLVFHDCTVAPRMRGDPTLLSRLPPHKTLFRAPPGRGLPIGNLNSQFFANVYLNALDQFAKHELKVRWYLRYCDDFVLLADSTEQLVVWRERVRVFLDERLGLALNDARERLCPVADGVDFLGYIVRPFHLLVRRRVIGHLREKLHRAQRTLIHESSAVTTWRFDIPALDALQAALASYIGHFRWAAHRRLLQAIWRDNPWLAQFFARDVTLTRLRRRDRPPSDGRNVLGQYAHWCREFPDDEIWIQVGAFIERLQWPPRRLPQREPRQRKGRDTLHRMGATRRGALEGFPLPQLSRRVAARLSRGRSVMLIAQTDARGGRLVQRRPVRRWVNAEP